MRALLTLILLLSVFACRPRPGADAEPSPQPPPPPPDTLSALRAAGVLRALVTQAEVDDVPRAESALAEDWSALEELAIELGVTLERVVVPSRADLVTELAKGRGDLIAEPLLVTASPELSFSAPLRAVDLVVVTTQGRTAPRKRADLRGVVLPTALLLPQTEHEALGSTQVADGLDDQGLLQAVGNGQHAVALTRSDALAAYQAYADDVHVAFTLQSKRPVAWAVRPACVELRQAMTQFVQARELTRHQRERHADDLPGIMKRKVLRVAMLNNGASYFLYRGQELGFQYELAALLASRLGVRLQVVVPKQPAELVRLVQQGKVDVAPISLTEAGIPAGLRVSQPIATSRWVLVQRAGEPPITQEAELARREVHVRASSAYRGLLETLAKRVPGLRVVFAPEDLETEDLIDAVGAGVRPLTVSNELLFDVERTYRDDVQKTLVLAEEQPLVYAVGAHAAALQAKLNALLERELRGAAYKAIYAKYFHDARRMSELRAAEASTSGVISPYDDLVRQAVQEHNLDWRLVLAQMYQESRFNPDAKSWVGAVGLMQLMPRTAAELGVRNIRDPGENIRAGVKYFAKLLKRFDASIPMRQRVRMALAGYNAGFEHVQDARILAKKKGWDPNRWFGHVEKAMLLLEKPAYYRKARRGYCRGREPVAYVSRIQSKYDAYVALMPGMGPALSGED